MLYTAGKPNITLADAQEVVSAESSHDDWAVTNAIQNGNAKEALRQLALALDAGARVVSGARAARVVRARQDGRPAADSRPPSTRCSGRIST